CGALGSVAADMLARAGVGHLVIVDRDFVELTNLQRQVLFDERDVADALPKAVAARRKLQSINSEVTVTAVVDDVNHENIVRLADGADVLVDGVDNLETRYLANDYAVRHAVPYVYGAAVGTTGMAFPVLPHGDGNAPWEQAAGGNHATPCFRCLFEEAPPPGTVATCDTVGVIGPAVAMIANFQVAEALKILTGNYSRVTRTLNSVDLWANELSQLKVASAYDKGNCPCCKGRRFDYLDGRLGSSADVLCGRNAVQLRHRQQRSRIDLQTVAGQLHAHGRVQSSEFMVRATIDDRDNPYEITVFADGRAIVKGTDEPGVARSVYAKYVGA
ncbi:MAG: ThiF family adenylyltransferase, partial [Pseudomonadota bacterium]